MELNNSGNPQTSGSSGNDDKLEYIQKIEKKFRIMKKRYLNAKSKKTIV